MLLTELTELPNAIANLMRMRLMFTFLVIRSSTKHHKCSAILPHDIQEKADIITADIAEPGRLTPEHIQN